MENAELIAQARKLSEKATPRPWKYDGAGSVYRPDEYGDGEIDVCECDDSCSDDAENNGNFIAASRSLVPKLCDALEAAEKRVKELEEAQRWIPCDTPPKEDGDYLGYYSLEKVMFKAKYRRGTWEVKSNECYSALWKVTHWQPLPQPPQKG